MDDERFQTTVMQPLNEITARASLISDLHDRLEYIRTAIREFRIAHGLDPDGPKLGKDRRRAGRIGAAQDRKP